MCRMLHDMGVPRGPRSHRANYSTCSPEIQPVNQTAKNLLGDSLT